MIFILDKSMNIRDSLSNSGEISHITPFFDDIYTSYLETGAETYQFSTLANTKESQHLIVGNHIAFQYEDEYKLFTITEIEETHDENFIKTVYCEMAGLKLINKVIRPMTFSSTNLRKFLEEILSDTDWNIGLIDIGLNNVCDIEVKDYTNAYSLLQTHIRESYKGEIHFTVKFEGSKATKYINVYSNRGQFDGFRFSYDSNLTSITRTINFDDLATALIGVGNNGLTFKEIETEDKPLNQDFITDESAYLLWNDNGSHILGYEKFDTDSPQELLKLTREKLKERCQPKIKYELNPELLGETVKIGDTVYVIDNEFNPPIHLSARINQLSISLTDKSNNSCVLSNFTEITSNITEEMRQIASQLEGYVDGQFPIGGDKIQDGAINGDKLTNGQIIQGTHIFANSITADHIQAETIDTEHLKADSIDAEKIQANSITSNHIQSNTIETEHLKANIIQSEHIQSNTIDANHIISNSINSGHIQTGSITAGSGIIADGAIGNAQISKIDAGKIEAGTIDTSKVTIQGSNGHLRLKGNRMQVFEGTGNQAKERVSVGDVNGDGSVYGLRVRGADGQTILLDENGVTSEGITDGSITNDKISDDANIDGAKLNINSVVSKINEDGTETIQGTKIEVDGTTLNTKLSTITNKQTEDSERITQAQTQISANTNAIKLKVDSQTYQTDKTNMTTQMNKNTSEISAMKGEIALKVEQADIENAVSEIEGVIDTKVESAKSEIKITTDAISQNVSNLSQAVSNKADGSTVSSLNSKVSSLETSVNGISGKVTSLEKTTTTLGTQVDTANTNASSALNKANSATTTANNAQNTANTNKNNITNLQGEVSTVKSNIASLEVTTSGISQKVSSVESTTATLSGKVDTANNNATNALNTANNANSKVEGLQIGGRNLIRNSQNYSNWLGENGTTVSTIDNSNEPTKILQVTTNGSASGHVKINVSNYIKGKEYILSFYAKNISGDKTINFEPHGGPVYSVTSTSEWVQYKVKIIPNQNWSSTSPYFYFNNKNNTSVFQIKNVKLEEGNKATDWTPAPEDVDGAINSVDSKVDTLRTEYNSTKSKVATIETNLSGITSRVSSAETNIEKISNASSQNLLYNSDFRIINGSLPDGWSTDSSKITLDPNTTLLDGIPTFWFNVTGLTENAWKAVYSPFISAKAGEKFVASAYVIGHNNWSVLDAGGGLEIEYYNDSGRISTSYAGIDKNNLNWQRLVVKGIAPTGTTRVRIRVHPVKNGQFNMSKPMLQYGETVTGWDRGFDINNLTTRLKTAESKITDDAITNVVKKNFYTFEETEEAIVSKGYQTASQVQQTVNGLEVKVTQSGGYNLLKNSAFANNSFDKWWTWGPVTRWTNLTYYKEEGDMYIANSSTTDAGGLWQTIETPILPNTEYTLSVLVSKEGNVKGGYFAMEYQETVAGSHFTAQVINLTFDGKRHSYTFTTPNDSRVKYAKCGFRHDGSNSESGGFLIRINKPCLTTGRVNVWSPHPNEIYDGITTIDKDGITVSNSSSSTHTQIDSSSFRVENNTGGTVAEFSQNSQIPNLTAGIITANEIYSPNICTKSPMSGSIKYIVNGSTGNDNNNGTTYSTPFKTVAKAVSMLNTQQDRSVDIEIYGSVTGFDVKGINGTGAIRFYFSDDAIVNGAVIIGGITNTIGFHGGSSDKATFKNGISIYRCRDVEIGSLTFRGTNSSGTNIYLEDVTFARIMSCDLGGLSTQLLCAVQARRSNLWIYNCIGSKITDVVAQSEFSIAYAPRAGTTKVPDYSNVFLCNYDGDGRIHNWSGGNFVKTPSKGWNPAYTPTQRTSTWSFNKIWSDETLHGWSDRQELIQGYSSTWNTGRWTGYMQFTDGMDAIRSAISGGTNLSGRIYVQRTSSSGNSTGSKLCLYASDGTLITNSTTINRSQGVWVSLSSSIIQKIQSGAIQYFYLKADSNNSATYFKCERNCKIEITYTK